jgi:hypothetical protein
MGIGLRRLNPTGFVPVAISSFISVKKRKSGFIRVKTERKESRLHLPAQEKYSNMKYTAMTGERLVDRRDLLEPEIR